MVVMLEKMNAKSVTALVLMVVLPALMLLMIVFNTSSAETSFDSVPAAIVNLDKGATLDIQGDSQFVLAGRQIEAGLLHPTDDSLSTGNLNWEIVPEHSAKTGFEDGKYHAVLTIPANFSEELLDVFGDDDAPALLNLQTDGSSELVKYAAQDVIDSASVAFVKDFQNQALSKILLQVEDAKTEFETVVDASAQLADGAQQLADGSEQLVSGADQVSSGAQQLAGGAWQSSSGASSLASGATQSHTGAKQLAGGLQQLRDSIASQNTSETAAEVQQLKDNITNIEESANGTVAAAEAISNILYVSADGTNPPGAIDYLKQIVEKCNEVSASISLPQVQQLCAQLSAKAQEIENQTAAYKPGDDGSDAPLVQAAKAEQALLVGPNSLVNGTIKAYEGQQQLLAALDGSQTQPGLVPAAWQLAGGLGKLSTGAGELSTGIGKLATGAGTLADGASQLGSGATELSYGSSQLADGTNRLAQGLAEGIDQIPEISKDQGEKLSAHVTDPVKLNSVLSREVPTSKTLLFPDWMTLLLWLGAFGALLLTPPLRQKALSSALSAFQVAFRSWMPALLIGLLQATLLFIAALIGGVRPISVIATIGVLLLAVACFTAVNQGLISLFGYRVGRLLSLLFWVIQVAYMAYRLPVAKLPQPLDSIASALPLPGVSSALAITAANQPGQLFGTLLSLVVWAFVSLAGTAFIASRQRRINAESLN